MDFNALCIGCRTYRRFKQKQIPEEILDELLENSRIANSAMNGQPLRYVLVKTPEAVRKIQSCFHFAAALPKELGQPKEGEQPAAFIILCTEGRETPWTGIDIGIAVRTMNLNAYVYGIGSCIIGNVEFEKVKEIIVDSLSCDEDAVTLEANLKEDLDADSLDAVELIMAVEEEFDIEIPDEKAAEIKTVQDIVDYIKANA